MTLQVLKAQTLKQSIYQIEHSPEGSVLRITRRRDGSRSRQPTTISLTHEPDKTSLPLIDYIVRSLAAKTPSLLNIMIESSSVLKLASYFYNYKTGSETTLRSYLWRLSRFCLWVGKNPDTLIGDFQGKRNTEKARLSLQEKIESFLIELKGSGLAPSTIQDFWKTLKTFYSVNGVKLSLPHPLPRQVRYHDRSPTPEELSKVLDVAGLREKVIVSLLSLGGFRESTLVKLRYRHVRRDLEAGVTTIHVHVEAEITKGKYGDYDTFIGAEAADFLRLYLEERRRGTEKLPPEVITEDSPLIRAYTPEVRPLREDQVFQLVHELFRKAGVLGSKEGSRYQLRVHSLRKYFRTQLAALGVPSDYAEFMMGHKISTYHDIAMKGPEFLRGIYTTSGLSIKPKTRVGRLEMLKEVVRSLGLDPEKILVKEALVEPHRSILEPENQVKLLSHSLREFLLREVSGGA